MYSGNSLCMPSAIGTDMSCHKSCHDMSECIKKSKQFWNGSQPGEAAWSMKFFYKYTLLGYLQFRINENNLKFKCFKPRGVHIMKHIKNGLWARFKSLKVISSCWVENMLGVLLLFKMSRNLIEFKPFKMSCERIFFSIRIVFLKKCSNFN